MVEGTRLPWRSSMAIAWRAARTVGIGLAVVPPSAYGTAQGQFPVLARGYDTKDEASVRLPAPYRYMAYRVHAAGRTLAEPVHYDGRPETEALKARYAAWLVGG